MINKTCHACGGDGKFDAASPKAFGPCRTCGGLGTLHPGYQVYVQILTAGYRLRKEGGEPSCISADDPTRGVIGFLVWDMSELDRPTWKQFHFKLHLNHLKDAKDFMSREYKAKVKSSEGRTDLAKMFAELFKKGDERAGFQELQKFFLGDT